jgi:hypothetical protein
MSTHDDALTHLLDRAPDLRPDGWIDRTLIAYPREFGAELAPILIEAAACIARHGDERSRHLASATDSPGLRNQAIARVRRILAARPGAIERAAPALLHCGGGAMLVALAHPVPHAEHTAANLQHALISRPLSGQLTLRLERHCEVAHRGQRVRVFLAEYAAADLQHALF